VAGGLQTPSVTSEESAEVPLLRRPDVSAAAVPALLFLAGRADDRRLPRHRRGAAVAGGSAAGSLPTFASTTATDWLDRLLLPTL